MIVQRAEIIVKMLESKEVVFGEDKTKPIEVCTYKGEQRETLKELLYNTVIKEEDE